MASDWLGTAVLRGRTLVYAGAVGRTDLHAHHAFQIAVRLQSEIALRDAAGRCMSGAAAVVPCDVPHALETAGSAVLIFVDPDDVAGRRLRKLALGRDVCSWLCAGERLLRLASDERRTDVAALAAFAAEAVEELTGPLPPPGTVHPAVTSLLAELPSRLDGDVRLPVLAKIAGLSEGRLTHVFKEVVGIPLRQYVLWLRLQAVVNSLQAGASLTAAAHAAGFSDSSHLSHAFRRMFGLAPSEVAGSVRWITENPGRS
jgi:AraC-like DNA-binding protein